MALPSKPSIKNVWATSGLKVEPSDAKVDTGWIVERPPHQFQNFLQNRVDQFIKHVNEAGIPVWDAVTIYTSGKSYVQGSDGKIYKCVVDGFNNNPVGNPTKWTLTFGDLAVQEYANIAEAAAIEAEASAEEAANAAAAAGVSEDASAASAADALNSELAAEAFASAAAASQISATNSASSASTSATNAGNSATLAQDWAIKTDGPVSGGEFSAKWWAQSIAAGPVASWIGLTDVIDYAEARTALNITNVDNTSDATKPVSGPTQTQLDLKSNLATTVTKDSNTGAANIPVGTTAQRPTPDLGKFRINQDTSRAEMGNGTSFVSLGGATGGGNDAVFYLNDSVINNDFTISNNQNAGTFGPVEIATGKTITVNAGSTWSIV
jgi:hypothetical protein